MSAVVLFEVCVLVVLVGVVVVVGQPACDETPPCIFNKQGWQCAEVEPATVVKQLPIKAWEDWLHTQASSIDGGFYVAVSYRGHTALSQGFGFARASDKTVKPTQDSIFRLGSVTKLLTSAMAIKSREQGVLSLDDSVSMPFSSYFKLLRFLFVICSSSSSSSSSSLLLLLALSSPHSSPSPPPPSLLTPPPRLVAHTRLRSRPRGVLV